MKLRALIADDEPLARERLRFLLADEDAVEIAGECRNGREVVDALQREKIDVLFLDIEMPGLGGFEAIAETGMERMPVTVFVTAHSHYALRAFEARALDYLTKPVDPERLSDTLVRVKERVAAQGALAAQHQLASMLSSLGHAAAQPKEFPRRLVVPNGSKDAFVPVEEIEWIEAADYYCCLHVGPRNLMLRESIKQLAQTLDPKRFVRIHRSVIVNVDKVREIFREGRSEGSVTLVNGQRLRMSKAGWQNLLAVSRG
jgi:two-component system LytT family response regulator